MILGGGMVAGDIGIELSCQAEGADADRKSVRLADGREIGFESLIVATGERVRTLEIPGHDIAGLYHLRISLVGNGESAACDIVVAGIGVTPVTGVLANSGIEIADGAVVNEYIETSLAGIYAAGRCKRL